MLKGIPEKTFRSSAVTTPCALSITNPSSSQIVGEQESAFSFSLINKRGLFEEGVGISSTEVAGEAILVVSTPETMGVAEAIGVTNRPFPVTRTPFFLMLDSGLSFLDLIFAYIPLLNLVVISTRRKTLVKKKKKIQVYKGESILTSSILTFFSFDADAVKT